MKSLQVGDEEYYSDLQVMKSNTGYYMVQSITILKRYILYLYRVQGILSTSRQEKWLRMSWLSSRMVHLNLYYG